MSDPQDPIEHISRLLESKSTAKQVTYKNLLSAFKSLSAESKRVIGELKKKSTPGDEDVTLDFKQISEHEFDVKLAGDLLVFILHTNIVTFDDAHPVMQSEY